jgi:hypothetical protein
MKHKRQGTVIQLNSGIDAAITMCTKFLRCFQSLRAWHHIIATNAIMIKVINETYHEIVTNTSQL